MVTTPSPTDDESFSHLTLLRARADIRYPRLQTTWQWSQSSSGSIVADVAYDLFTANSVGGANTNEIMVWLANYNAGPIASSYDASGQPVPNESNISLAGTSW